MHRRDLFALLGVVASLPFGARAQQQSAAPEVSKERQALDINRSVSVPENGLVSVQSQSAQPETTKRLLAALAKRDLTVFARIDHAAGAASVGLPLRPTELVILATRKAALHLCRTNSLPVSTCPLRHWFGRILKEGPGLPTTIQAGSHSATLLVPAARRL